MENVISKTQMKAPDGYTWKQIDEETIKLAKKEKPKLHLEASRHLSICYKNSQVGIICEDGKAWILSSAHGLDAYEEWRKEGMLVNNSKVIWGNRVYQIGSENSTDIILKSEAPDEKDLCYIYDFEECNPMINQDPNIVKHKHNNRTIIF